VVSHLDVVLVAEVSERLSALHSSLRELRDRAHGVHVELLHHLAEDETVLEGRVHALPVEGHHCVCGVADDEDLAARRIVGVALNLQQRRVGRRLELDEEVRHERDDVGEVPTEVGEDLLVCVDSLERVRPLEGEEERAGE
jgi:hypothetical protein